MKPVKLIRLSAQMGLKHKGLYAASAFTIAATSMIASIQVSIGNAFGDPGRVKVASLNRNEMTAQLGAIRGLLITLGAIVIIILGFLLFSSIKQNISLRTRELAMIRLTGASRRQISLMIFIECSLLGFAVGLPVTLMGNAVAGYGFLLYQFIGFFGQSVSIDIPFSPALIFIIACLVSFISGIAGLFAALTVTRGELIGALQPLSKRTKVSELLWRIILFSLCLISIMLTDLKTLGSATIMLIPLFAVFPLLIIAPVLVPVAARFVGRLLAFFFPGPAMLASQRAFLDRHRFVSTAAPLILAIGLLGGFYVANIPDENMLAQSYRQQLKASTVINFSDVKSADRFTDEVKGRTTEIVRIAQMDRVVLENLQTIYFGDPVAFEHMMSLQVVEGDLSNVNGTNVASGLKGAEIGDTYMIMDGNGEEKQLTVVALYKDEAYEGVFLNWNQINNFMNNESSTVPASVFLSSNADSSVYSQILKENNLKGEVLDANGYVEQRIAERRANTSRSNIGLFGVIYIMSLISLTQTSIASSMARHREFNILRSIGVNRRGVVAVSIIESIILLFVSGVLVFTILIILAIKFTPGGMPAIAKTVIQALPVTMISFATMGGLLLGLGSLSTYLSSSNTSDKDDAF